MVEIAAGHGRRHAVSAAASHIRQRVGDRRRHRVRAKRGDHAPAALDLLS
jgi:hypothetical protein